MGTGEAPALFIQGEAGSLQSGSYVGIATQDASPHVLYAVTTSGRGPCDGDGGDDDRGTSLGHDSADIPFPSPRGRNRRKD